MITDTLIGKGIYSIPDAARIAHTDTRSISRWTMGYTTPKARRFSEPILPTRILKVGEEEVVTFNQLIEILFVNLFRKYKVPMSVIREAANYAAREFKTDHPFAVEGFKTDGRRIFHQVEVPSHNINATNRTHVIHDVGRGQFVFGEFVEPYFLRIDYDRFEAIRYWPLGKDKHIVIDPTRSFGQPIDVETSVPTKALYKMYEGGDSVEMIGNWYRVKRQAVIDAIAFEESLKAA